MPSLASILSPQKYSESNSGLPEASYFGNYAPSTGEVTGAFVDSAMQDFLPNWSIDSKTIEEQTRGYRIKAIPHVGVEMEPVQREPLTMEQWQGSEFYRPSIKYFDGMTKLSARILARRKDVEERQGYLSSRATFGQNAAGFGAALGVSIFDPINLLTAGAGFEANLGIKLAELGTLGKYAYRFGKGALENAAIEAATQPLYLTSADTLQADYTMSDALMNVLFASGAGGAFHVAGGIGADFMAARSRRIDTKANYEAATTALRQVMTGQPVEVQPILKAAERSAELRADLEFYRAPPEAKMWDAGPIEKGKHADYTPVRNGDVKWIEGVNYELQQSQGGGLVFDYNVEGQGGTPGITPIKGDTPAWFTEYNKSVATNNKARAKEKAKLASKGVVADKTNIRPSESTLTREKVAAVTEKLLAGKPLGKAEASIAETIVREARARREENIRQMLGSREDRQILRENDLERRAIQEEYNAEQYRRQTDPKYISTADPEAAAHYTEIAEQYEPRTLEQLDAEYQEMRQSLKDAFDQGYIDESDFAEIEGADALFDDLTNHAEGYRAAGLCMSKN